MTNELTLENIRSGAFPSDAHAVGFLLGEVERLRTQIEILQRANHFLSEQIPSAHEPGEQLPEGLRDPLKVMERVRELQNRCRSGLGRQGEFLSETQCTLQEGHSGPHNYASDPRQQGASRDASSLACRYCPARFMTAWEHEVHEKEHAVRTGPTDLVGALQDVVHTDPGPVRAGKSARVVPSICGKPMPDGKGAGQCINPPGHEGDCDDMPF